jgi:DNA transformation protein
VAVDPGFLEFVQDLLSGIGPIRAKRMFGGVGLYAQDLFFAIGDEDALYLKVDDVTEPEFAAAGSHPFRVEWTPPKPTALKAASEAEAGYTMRYWRLPDSALDDPEEAVRWANLALDAARRAATRKKPRRAKP